MPGRSALPLLVPRVGADDPHHALALDHFAIAANPFNRSQYFHDALDFSFNCVLLLGAENNPPLGQIVRRQFHRHFVAGEDADEVLAHFA